MDWSSDTMVFSCVFHTYINYTYALFNPFAPEPPVTARADQGPFYPL